MKKEKRLKEVTYMFGAGIILCSILFSIAIWISEYSLSEKFIAQGFDIFITLRCGLRALKMQKEQLKRVIKE